MSGKLKYYGPSSIDELRSNILLQHEEFLTEDDAEKKADALRYFNCYASQFLSLVPHDKKFVFKETERVLHQSAMNISDFDPREASVAFEFLGKYAENMLNQPWRRDFRTIKLTSGFYVHNISSHLTNPHELLVAMGYVHVDSTTLQASKMDERRLKSISRDMLLASQECLILSSIWQRAADKEPDYPLTIGEVFEFRVRYVGDTDAIVKTLVGDIRKRSKANNVAVERLIDHDVHDNELVEKVLENTRLLQGENYYDDVYEKWIPKTVEEFKPIIFSKVKKEEVDGPLKWSEFSAPIHEQPTVLVPPPKNRSRAPLMPSDVYSDDYFPKQNKEVSQETTLPSLSTLYYNQLINGNSEVKEKKAEKKSPQPPQLFPPWPCPFCTYKNKKNEKICEVCAKSRDFEISESEEEEPKLYSVKSSDKIKCPQCTLENFRGKLTCEACGGRLILNKQQ